jgi:arylsulfatase A-like enzyme
VAGAAERVIAAELLPYPNLKEHHVAILRGRYKLIHRLSENLLELYDLSRDPGETENLYRVDREATAAMEAVLESFDARTN